MKILIINYFFPPVVDAHAYRWGQLASYLASQGHDVMVLTGGVKGQSAYEVQDGVTIQRIGLLSRPVMLGGESGITDGSDSVVTKWRRSLFSAIRPLYRSVYWPDGWWHWLPALFSTLWRRRRGEYDLLITYSPCFGAHLAGLALRRWGRIKRWVADYGDPFSPSESMPPNNFRLYNRLNHYAESRVLSSADEATFTTLGTLNDYRNAFGDVGQMRLVPHLVDIDRLHAGEGGRNLQASIYCSPSDTAHDESEKRIILAYVGGFHRGIREPALMLKVATALHFSLPQVQMHIFGPSNGVSVNCDGVCSVFHGPVARVQALEIIQNANILVNVQNQNCAMIPSKIVEYIATGRPIVNIGKSTFKNEVLDHYAELGMVFNVNDDNFAKCQEQLVDFVKSKASVIAPLNDVQAILRNYDLRSIAGAYL